MYIQMYIPCLQTENQNNFSLGTLENNYGHWIFVISFMIFESELERNVATQVAQLAQSPKWTFEFTGPNQIPVFIFIYNVVLNKNWK